MGGSKLLVVWDGLLIHRSNEIKAFLADGRAQFVQLEKLLAYAPDLNPDESVWQHLKHESSRFLLALDWTSISG